MKKVIFLSLMFALIISLNANAQLIDKFAQKKQVEIAGSFGFASYTPVVNGETGDATTQIMFEPSVGYFITKGFEVKAGIGINYIKPSGGDGTTTYAFLVGPEYNFHTKSQFYPYLGGQIGYNGISNTGDGLKGIIWNVGGGVKANLLGNSLLKLGILYTQQTLNPKTFDKRNGMNSISATIGIGMFF